MKQFAAKWGGALTTVAWLGMCLSGLLAQNRQPGRMPPHEHRLIEIPGEPILSRVEVELERPSRVAIGPRNGLFLVDAVANKVVRVSGDKKAVPFASGLNDPSGICFDSSGTCYVSNFARGAANAGSVVRIAGGKTTVIAGRLTGPKGMAFGRDGKLYVALFGDNRIITIDSKGQLRDFCRNVTAPAAVCFDAKGMLYAANPADGTVTRITPAGKAAIGWRGLNMPTDLAVSLEGEILATCYGDATIRRLLPRGKSEAYLRVPTGTIAACIDAGGNAVVVNWDLKLAVRIRDRLTVPCPHCRKMIPLRIKPRATVKKAKSKSAI